MNIKSTTWLYTTGYESDVFHDDMSGLEFLCWTSNLIFLNGKNSSTKLIQIIFILSSSWVFTMVDEMKRFSNLKCYVSILVQIRVVFIRIIHKCWLTIPVSRGHWICRARNVGLVKKANRTFKPILSLYK